MTENNIDWIKTVKIQEDGWLVNNSMSIPDDKGNRHYQEVQEWIAEGNTPEPQYSLKDLQKLKLNELEVSYNIANQEAVVYMDTTFQADNGSQSLIVSVLSAGNVPDGFYWLNIDNNQVSMSYADLQGLSGVILERGQGNFTKLQDLKKQVKGATTQDALDSIVW